MKSARPLLGTYVVVEVDDADEELARTAVDAAFDAIARVQRLMSAFDAGSDVCRINAHAHLEPVTVHRWTADVLALALQMHADSDGLFDIGIAPRLAKWNYLPSSELDYKGSTVANLSVDGDAVSCAAPTRIDLGGIAKGYAVDRAIDAALAAGARSVLVNAGGDLRVAGDAGQPICLRNPSTPSQLALAGHLQDGAMATSGTYYSSNLHEGMPVSAIVDPQTQAPLLSRDSHSVIASSCAVADALTKVVALSGNLNHPALRTHRAQALVLQAS